MENKFKKYLIEQEEIEMEQELEETNNKIKEFIKTSEELSTEKLVEFAEENEIPDVEGIVLSILKSYIVAEEEGGEEETEDIPTEDDEEVVEEFEDDLDEEVEEEIEDITEGVGYELYAKGVDRVSKQCETISDSAKTLSKLVRDDANSTKKKRAVKNLEKWVGVLNKEMDGIVSDIDNLEGYKN